MCRKLVFNIRQKVIFGLTLGMLAIALVGGLSFRYLKEIERKQHLVEVADDLNNIILEMRRYEKNYLLYGSEQDFEENLLFIEQGRSVIQSILPEMQNLQGAPRLNLLEQEFLAYRATMDQIEKCANASLRSCNQQMEDVLREQGKKLLDISHQLVSYERQRILLIINTLKNQLAASVALFVVTGSFLIVIVNRKIIRPLNVVEKATLQIAQGDFSHLPITGNPDETQRVLQAFNRMISELEKRQEQLLQARKLSSIGILTSGVAHQLNNPLNNISTSCQILMEEFGKGDPQFSYKLLTNIEQEVNRARDTVKGLLEFSRDKEFALVPHSLKEVVERSVRLISSQVPPGIDIVRDVPEDMILNLDAQRLQEVFLNLLMNAIQAIERPPGEIRITAEPDPANHQAVITIEDSGVGIPEANFNQIFDPFFTTKPVGTGTGMGLSIVYGIVQKHQGIISVESKVGEGTRFCIRLPLS